MKEDSDTMCPGRGASMMGSSESQPELYYNISLEEFVPEDHPLRAIRPLIDDRRIRELCRPLYSDVGRPSIPPEQLLKALVGGFLLGVTTDRKIVMELQCNMALRWFVGLDLNQDAWDDSTFSQNRRRRFDASGLMERLFDETVRRAIDAGLVSLHTSADGTLVRANASYKSFVPIELMMDAQSFKRRLRSRDSEEREPPEDPGNPRVDFRGEKRGNQTHRSNTDADCRFVSKGSSGTGAYPGYTVNALMENRNRILLGLGVEIFASSRSETEGAIRLLDRARRRFRYRPKSVGMDKGYFSKETIRNLIIRRVQPHIAADSRGGSPEHARVRMRARGKGYKLSQRCRKKIEELYGEAKDLHGLRRFRRRGLGRVREETWLIGWVLNLKRLAKLPIPLPATG
jgi:transposase